MADKNNLINNQNKGFFQDLIDHTKLIMRLMSDSRVNFLLKLLPIAAVVYVISPVDLLPEMVIPFIGMLDDAVAIWLGSSLFISLCPDEVVQEHMNALRTVVAGTWRDASQEKTNEIIDAEEHDNQDEQ